MLSFNNDCKQITVVNYASLTKRILTSGGNYSGRNGETKLCDPQNHQTRRADTGI